MYTETWYVKRESKSEPEKVVLFFKDKLNADVAHHKAVKEKDARLFFGSDFPEAVASCWQ